MDLLPIEVIQKIAESSLDTICKIAQLNSHYLSYMMDNRFWHCLFVRDWLPEQYQQSPYGSYRDRYRALKENVNDDIPKHPDTIRYLQFINPGHWNSNEMILERCWENIVNENNGAQRALGSLQQFLELGIEVDPGYNHQAGVPQELLVSKLSLIVRYSDIERRDIRKYLITILSNQEDNQNRDFLSSLLQLKGYITYGNELIETLALKNHITSIQFLLDSGFSVPNNGMVNIDRGCYSVEMMKLLTGRGYQPWTAVTAFGRKLIFGDILVHFSSPDPSMIRYLLELIDRNELSSMISNGDMIASQLSGRDKGMISIECLSIILNRMRADEITSLGSLKNMEQITINELLLLSGRLDIIHLLEKYGFKMEITKETILLSTNSNVTRYIATSGLNIIDKDGSSPLNITISRSNSYFRRFDIDSLMNRDQVQVMIDLGADLNKKGEFCSPLSAAVRRTWISRRDDSIIELLLDNGAVPDKSDKYILWHYLKSIRSFYGVDSQSNDIICNNIRRIAAHSPAELLNGNTFIDIAIRDIPMMEALSESGVDVTLWATSTLICRLKVEGNSYNNYAPLRYLLSKVPSNEIHTRSLFQQLKWSDPSARSPSYSAIIDVMKGADINAVDSQGRTPLLTAILNNRDYDAWFLINAGAKISPEIINQCVLQDKRWLIGFMKNCDVDLNCYDQYGISPLMYASYVNPSIIQLLLDCGADPNFTKDVTALEILISGSINRISVDAINILLRYGADINLCRNRSRIANKIIWYIRSGLDIDLLIESNLKFTKFSISKLQSLAQLVCDQERYRINKLISVMKLREGIKGSGEMIVQSSKI